MNNKRDNIIDIKSSKRQISKRDFFKSLINIEIIFNDSTCATIKNTLPNNKNMYSELFKKYPTYNYVDNIKELNDIINENLIFLLKNSFILSKSEKDKNNKHQKNKIVSFDTRRTNFKYNGDIYIIDFSIAKMIDKNNIIYTKKYLEKIKRNSHE